LLSGLLSGLLSLLLGRARSQVAKRGGTAGWTAVDQPDVFCASPAAIAHQTPTDAVYGRLWSKDFNELRNVELRHAVAMGAQPIQLETAGEFSQGLL